MQISVQSLDYFLNYNGSVLKPVVKASIYYNQTGQNIHYQDLFYSHSQTIGCRQYHALALVPGTAGTIQITNLSSNDQQQGYAAANAVLRSFLSLYVQKLPLKNVTVAAASSGNLMQGLWEHGFQSFEAVPGQIIPATVTLDVVSEPDGNVQHLSYVDNDNAM